MRYFFPIKRRLAFDYSPYFGESIGAHTAQPIKSNLLNRMRRLDRMGAY